MRSEARFRHFLPIARTFCMLMAAGLGCWGRADSTRLGGETNWPGSGPTVDGGAPDGGVSDAGALADPAPIQLLPSEYLCVENPVLSGEWRASDLRELEAFRGCQEIDTLDVNGFDVRSLDALSELRRANVLTIAPIDPGFSPEPVPLRPLAGLENLESAESLTLAYFSDADLRVLRSLKRVGSLSLIEAPNLTDLAALTGAEVDMWLRLEGLPELRDITGPVLGDASKQLRSLELDGVPKLERVGPVRGVTSIESLQIIDTGLVNVDDFAALAAVEFLLISANSALTELDGFSALRTAAQVLIAGNPVLVSGEGLSGLESLQFLEVRSNTQLVELAEFRAITAVETLRIESNYSLISDVIFPSLVRGNITIQLNDRLPTLLFPRLEDAPGLNEIAGNSRLNALEFPALRSADQLQIAANAVLVRLDLSVLEDVSLLELIDNASLEPAGISLPVATAERFGVQIGSAP